MNFYLMTLVIFAIFGLNFAIENPICSLKPMSNGEGGRSCRAHMISWSYDPKKKSCVEFIYGGCRGNKNRFKSEAECESKCVKNQSQQKLNIKA